MEDSRESPAGVVKLHTNHDIALLDDIDELRSQGINHYVSLPQLVVCGDQSSGKSSVLEAISGIPFPTKDQLCTRFATEVILRRASHVSVQVTIIPGPKRSETDKIHLSRFHGELSCIDTLPSLIEDAKEAMGLTSAQNAFADDILRVEISGPSQQHLTIVDLPGLIHSENKVQSSHDIQLVHDLVQRYIENRRSIVLAIVSAANDYANQIVLKMSRKFDKDGLRTLGIITKPDILPPGSDSEMSYIKLAANADIEFRLGWHVLRNRDYKTRSVSAHERDVNEKDFFSQGLWQKLPQEHAGIVSLRLKLSRILLEQIKAELPSLLSEVQSSIDTSHLEMRKLGSPRHTAKEKNGFLLGLGQKFQALSRTAIDGTYEDIFFGDLRSTEGYNKRLRAVIQNLNIDFAEEMRLKGHQYQLVDQPDKQLRNAGSPILITRKKFLDRTHELLMRSRGRELPGMFNPLVVTDLFHEQSQPWKRIAYAHLDRTWNAVRAFLHLAVSHITDGRTAQAVMEFIFNPIMEEKIGIMRRKLDEIVWPYQKGHLITYNHYFTETIQKVRQKRSEDEIARKLAAISGSKSSPEEPNIKNISKAVLISALSSGNEVDMDKYACSEAVDCMQAFYKVALKSFVDSVAIHCVEVALVSIVTEIFSPMCVLRLSSEQIDRIAEESSESTNRRESLIEKIKTLKKGLIVCQRHYPRMAMLPPATPEITGFYQSEYLFDSEKLLPDSQNLGKGATLSRATDFDPNDSDDGSAALLEPHHILESQETAENSVHSENPTKKKKKKSKSNGGVSDYCSMDM